MKKSLGFSAAFLAVVVLISGGITKAADSYLAPIIEKNSGSQDTTALKEMFPDASEIAEITIEDSTGLITTAYEAKDAGFAYKVTNQGFAAPITFIIGIGNDGTIKGFKVLDISDTPGYGMKVGEPDFIASVVGKKSSDSIATIAGATISSSAVIKGIDAAKAHFNSVKGIEGGSSTPEPAKPAGTSIKIFRTLGEKTKGTVVDKKEDGDVLTFTVTSNGYAILEEGFTEVAPNKVIVVIDKAKQTIVSVEVVEVNDTKGVGTRVSEEAFVSQFKDLSIADETIAVDAVSGATVSSESVVNAVKAAIDASK
jgi:Na+-translocating ferredoxin:NAD+ oxidoreductase RnfG subunit